jgi:hypothetical protein
MRMPRKAGGVAVAVVPPGAHLEGDRQIDRPHRRLENARGLQFVAHQRRPGVAVDDLLDRAAEIEVDQHGAAIGVEFGRLGHDTGLAAGELDRHRLLLGAASRHRQGLPCFADRRLARDHLGDDERGAVLFDDAPERQIAHPRHRRQDDRVCERDGAKANAHGLLSFPRC